MSLLKSSNIVEEQVQEEHYMKGIFKKLILLCITCCLGFSACGQKEEPKINETETKVEETVSETPVKVTKEDTVEKAKTASVDDMNEMFQIVDKYMWLAYKDNSAAEVYICILVKNKSSDKVLCDLSVQGTVKDATTGKILDSQPMEIRTLYPGETGIMSCLFTLELGHKTETETTLNGCKYYSVDAFSGFKQSDLVFEDTTIKSDGAAGSELITFVTNNGPTVSTGLETAKVICKKNGEIVGYVEYGIPDLQSNQKQTLTLYGYSTLPTDCDEYIYFIDFTDITKL